MTPDPYPLASPAGVAVNEATGDVYVANNADDNAQTFEVDATGGSFTLTFENPKTSVKETTAPITYRKPPSTCQVTPDPEETYQKDELEAQALLETVVGAGNVSVDMNCISSTYKVTFFGALADLHVAPLTADTTGLTGPSPAVKIATTSPGGPGDEVQEFNDQGEFVLMFGGDVNKTKAKALASEAERDVCTAFEVEVDHVECQPGVRPTEPASEPGAFEDPAYVAVDSSGGAVYVGDGEDGLVTKFTEKGELVPTWGNGGPGEAANGQLVGKPPAGVECTVPPHEACPAAEPFVDLSGIAVDSSGNLWVDGAPSGKQRLFEFKRTGTFTGNAWNVPVSKEGNTGEGQQPNRGGIAVDSEDNVYTIGSGIGSTFVFKFTPVGGEIGNSVVSREGGGFAVDSGGDLYDNPGGEVLVYAGCHPSAEENNSAGCEVTERFGSAHPPGGGFIALDAAGAGDTLYAAGSASGRVSVYSVETVPAVVTGKPSGVVPPQATLTGTVNPAGVSLEKCFFEWGETEKYGEVAECEEPNAGEVPVDSSAHTVHAKLPGGVLAGHTYHYRLVALNEHDRLEPDASEGSDLAFGPPLLEGESSASVAAVNATVQAEVNPQDLDTDVRVEYGTEAGTYPNKPAAVDLGAGGAVQAVPFELHGLTPETVYHYRFVAENALGTVEGKDRTLRTQGAGTFALPDGRQWEMASPPDLRGAQIEPLNNPNERFGEDVQAAAQGSGIAYLTNEPVEAEVRGYPESAQAISTRTPTGWLTHALTVPHAAVTPTTLSFTGAEYRFFSADLSAAVVQPFGVFAPCTSEQGKSQPCLSPDASEQTASLQDTQTGTFTPLFTGCPTPLQEEEGEPCSQAVREHENVPPGSRFGAGKCEPVCGPEFVGASPDGQHVVLYSPGGLPEGTGLYEWSAGQLTFIGDGVLGSQITGYANISRHAISDDGSRVFFSNEHGLFMHDLTTGKTIEIAAGASTTFEDANAAGSKVFFNGQECEVKETTGKLECEVVAHDGEVIGASEDGSYGLFQSGEELAPGAVQGTCEQLSDKSTRSAEEAAQSCNLYVQQTGRPKLIAVLSGADYPRLEK